MCIQYNCSKLFSTKARPDSVNNKSVRYINFRSETKLKHEAMASADLQMLISSSEPAESQPLVTQNAIDIPQLTSRKSRCSVFLVPYRLFNVSQQGGIFMIVHNAFFLVALSACFLSAAIQPINIQSLWLSIPSGLCYCYAPSLGC